MRNSPAFDRHAFVSSQDRWFMVFDVMRMIRTQIRWQEACWSLCKLWEHRLDFHLRECMGSSFPPRCVQQCYVKWLSSLLSRTQTSLFFDENVRAKEGGKETTPAVCTLPMVPCGSSPVTRFALASAKNEAPEEEAVLVGCPCCRTTNFGRAHVFSSFNWLAETDY